MPNANVLLDNANTGASAPDKTLFINVVKPTHLRAALPKEELSGHLPDTPT